MSEATKSPPTLTEVPPPGPSEAELKAALDTLTSHQEKAVSMCVRPAWFKDFIASSYPDDGNTLARRNNDSVDYRTLSNATRQVVSQENKVCEMLRKKERFLIWKLEKMERDVESLNELNDAHRRAIRKDKELIREVRREMEIEERRLRVAHEQGMQRLKKENEKLREEMELKQGEMETEVVRLREAQEQDMQRVTGENETLREEIKKERELVQELRSKVEVAGMELRAAQEQEIQRFKRENERLREEIEKERHLIREDLRREVELGAGDIGTAERTLLDGQEMGERAKIDATERIAKD